MVDEGTFKTEDEMIFYAEEAYASMDTDLVSLNAGAVDLAKVTDEPVKELLSKLPKNKGSAWEKPLLYFDVKTAPKGLQRFIKNSKYKAVFSSIGKGQMVKATIRDVVWLFVISDINIPIFDIYAASSVGSDIYLNNKKIISGAYREIPSVTKGVLLKVGDVLFVRMSHRFDISNVWISVHNQDGQFMFNTSTKWHSYIPLDYEKWWDADKRDKLVKVSESISSNDREYDWMIKKIISSIKVTPMAKPITSKLNPMDYNEFDRCGGYLYYQINQNDLKVKRINNR
ncbi:MAG: hypothetical protein HQL31_01950 [Planctomycetes bacterium]|nr:hypothetical protein [Planctomycetota bacterium]